MASKYIGVKRHKRSIHKNCMRCNDPATVTATRKNGRMALDVHYCEAHAIKGGLIDE